MTESGWAGTANHRTVPGGYPHAYSSYFAASWRYRRMLELLDGSDAISAEDHWRFMSDTKNTMAAALAPMIADALASQDDTRAMAEVLRRVERDYQLETEYGHGARTGPYVFVFGDIPDESGMSP